ncbi:UNKNOWN [Stylonychia lemnae]|uniref:Transmembrane protein n=1 Tax=Stylonychia lemnae TaxID=5949 RepID=A0A078ASL4_STYLE|nr:UNKNOWN [Stylonychia lemnae]|eukprot:CDW85465.1 UNKNOWN [Stylonychia lemnae]
MLSEIQNSSSQNSFSITNIIKGIENKIIDADVYGYEIKLQYKGQTKNKTLFGGILTFLTVFLVLSYFSLQAREVNNDSNTVKSLSSSQDFSSQSFNITTKNFDFALRIQRMISNETQIENFIRFFSFKAFQKQEQTTNNQNTGAVTFFPQNIPIDLVKCDDSRLMGDSVYQSDLQIYRNNLWLCLTKEFNLLVDKSNFQFGISIEKCSQNELDLKYPGLKCDKNQTLINMFQQSTNIYLYSTNSFFDIFEFQNDPVKVIIDENSFKMVPGSTKNIKYRLSYDQARGSTSKMIESLDKFNYRFLSSELSSETADNSTSQDQFIKFEFIMSNQLSITERINKNFLGALSQTGGIMSIVVAFFTILSKGIQEFLFYSSIIASIFMTEKQQDPKKEKLSFKEKILAAQKSQQKHYSLETVDDPTQLNSARNLTNSRALQEQTIRSGGSVKQNRKSFSDKIKGWIPQRFKRQMTFEINDNKTTIVHSKETEAKQQSIRDFENNINAPQTVRNNNINDQVDEQVVRAEYSLKQERFTNLSLNEAVINTKNISQNHIDNQDLNENVLIQDKLNQLNVYENYLSLNNTQDYLNGKFSEISQHAQFKDRLRIENENMNDNEILQEYIKQEQNQNNFICQFTSPRGCFQHQINLEEYNSQRVTQNNSPERLILSNQDEDKQECDSSKKLVDDQNLIESQTQPKRSFIEILKKQISAQADNQNSAANLQDIHQQAVNQQEQTLKIENQNNYDAQKSNEHSTLARERADSEHKKFQTLGVKAYMALLTAIKYRQSFMYVLKEEIKDFLKNKFCCRPRSKEHKMYMIGKQKIEKQLDISNLIKELRVLKLVSNVYLNKHQRKLVPFFKKNMLSQKLSRQDIKKQEQNRMLMKKQNYLHNASDNLLELFTDCRADNKKSQRILDCLNGQSFPDETHQRTLKQKMFRGIMREYAVNQVLNRSEFDVGLDRQDTVDQEDIEIDISPQGPETESNSFGIEIEREIGIEGNVQNQRQFELITSLNRQK